MAFRSRSLALAIFPVASALALFPQAALSASLAANRLSTSSRAAFRAPKITLEPAPTIRFPADVDSNSPAFWTEAGLHVLNSNQNPSVSVGSDVENLGAPIRGRFLDGLPIPRWIEGVWRDSSGAVWGLYHREDYAWQCPERPYFTIPRIGIARSGDDAITWEDLGLVLADDVGEVDCGSSPNRFFAGGIGDPSWAIDETRGYAYVLYSSYAIPLAEQGIQIARLRLSELPSPVGKAFRWNGGSWTEPGLGGHGESVLKPNHSWHGPGADAFWGPSVHWNPHVGAHVILLNRTRGPSFDQEGAYVAYAPDITDPLTWTAPEKFYEGGDWYVQVFGDASIKGTDRLAGESARFFMHGFSNHRIRFVK